MSETLEMVFTEQGLLGALVVILLGVVGYLFKIIMNNHQTSLDQNTEVVRALTESANANNQVAGSVEQTNQLLRTLISNTGKS